MKKTFLHFAMLFAASMMVFSACEPEEKPDDNGGLKDPTEQPGGNENENPGNENDNPGGNENENPGGNQGGTIDGEYPSLNGTEYVTIALDEYTTAALGSKVKASYQLDDVNVFLYVWENTYLAGTPSGLNFYGEAAGWSSLVVGNVGWSGAGWCVTNPEYVPAFVDSTSDLSNWYFHIGYKGAANVAHIVILYWQGGEYKFAIGQGSLADAGVTYTALAPTSGTFQPNVWNEYEVCLADTGFNYAADNTTPKANLAAFLSGGVAGTTIDVDAVFFYKK